MTRDDPRPVAPLSVRRDRRCPHPAWARTAALAGCVLLLTACGAATTATSARTTAASATTPATSGHHSAHGHHDVVAGLLTAVSSRSIALRSRGKTLTVALGAHTRYRERGRAVRESALRKGEHLRVRLMLHASARTARVVTILPPSLVGTIRAIGTGRFLLAPAHGAVRPVTTAAATVYRSGTHKVAASALRVGERARVSGWPTAHGGIAAGSVTILAATKP